MYILVRTGKITPNKAGRARVVARELAQYATEELGVRTELLRNVGDDQWEVHWMIRFESLDQMTDTLARAHADEGHAALAKPMAEEELFISMTDRIYEVVA